MFADPADAAAVARAEAELRRTEITQPAVLTVDVALTRLLGAYGIAPDLVMGHSLGEYGALVAAGALSFEAALEAVSARGREMASLKSRTRARWRPSWHRSTRSSRSSPPSTATSCWPTSTPRTKSCSAARPKRSSRAIAALKERGHDARPLPVSHAFHTSIVAPASGPLQATLERLGVRAPLIPIVAQRQRRVLPVRR